MPRMPFARPDATVAAAKCKGLVISHGTPAEQQQQRKRKSSTSTRNTNNYNYHLCEDHLGRPLLQVVLLLLITIRTRKCEGLPVDAHAT